MQQAQLVMIRRTLDNVPEAPPPEGYRIRYHLDGDDERLAPIFQVCFDPGWNGDRVHKTFVEDPTWSPNRMCVAVCGEEVVGTATAWEARQRPGHGLVHYVAVAPEHRGRGVGKALVARVLEILKSMGYRDAWLTTDDFRLSAIRVYLKFGFEPFYPDHTHRERWEVIRHKLDVL